VGRRWREDRATGSLRLCVSPSAFHIFIEDLLPRNHQQVAFFWADQVIVIIYAPAELDPVGFAAELAG
jgi:hypothetical protein